MPVIIGLIAVLLIVCIIVATKLAKERPVANGEIDVSSLITSVSADYVPPKPNGATSYIFIDVETTGLNPEHDAIVQLSALRFLGEATTDGINTYINPGRPIPQSATEIHGITDALVRTAPTITQVQAQFMDFIDGAVLIGYNVKFDLNFLNKAFAGALEGVKYVDVLSNARCLLNLPNYRLETVSTHLGFKPSGAYHNSLNDCMATAAIFWALDLQSEAEHPLTYRSKTGREFAASAPTWGLPPGYEDWRNGERLRLDGDIDGAMESFSKAKISGYRNPALYESYAKIYRKCKDYTKEIEILTEGIQICGQSNARWLLERRDKAQKMLENQQKREAELREQEAKRAARAEKRRAEEELANSKPKQPAGRAIVQYTDDGEIVETYETVSAAAKAVGVTTKSIRSAAIGKQKHAGGFQWKYLDAIANAEATYPE